MQATANLTGPGGWTTVLVPLGVDQPWNGSVHLPPKCPGFDADEMLNTAYSLGLKPVVRLEPQYTVSPTGTEECNG